MDVRLVSGGPWAGCQDCQPLRCQRLAAATGAENRRSAGGSRPPGGRKGCTHRGTPSPEQTGSSPSHQGPRRDEAMASSGAESPRRRTLRRTTGGRTLLQDLLHKGGSHAPGELGREPRLIQSIAGLMRGKGQLLLLERPDAVEVYKLNKPPVRSKGAAADQLYLPRIPRRPSNLASLRASLSNSCPYLCDQRRGSVSSMCSQKTVNWDKKTSSLKALAEAKKSNVTVTMTYLGLRNAHSGSGTLQDELRVLQQVNGGENLCVFKGLVTPGERFQFLSQRHRGYPFSATMYVDGLMAARISSCCEYRYSPGFQQGQRSCFRLAWLSGGTPCHRCTSLRNKYGSCQQLNNGTKENLIPPLDRNAGKAPDEEHHSAPPLLPAAKPEKKKKKTLRQRTREHSREASCPSSDSEEDPAPAAAKRSSKPKRRKGRPGPREGKGGTGGSGGEGRRRGSKADPKETQVLGGYDGRTATHKQVQTDQESPGQGRTPRARRGVVNSGRGVVDSGGPQDKEALTRHKAGRKTEPGTNEKSRDGDGTKDYYEECLDMSAALERRPNQHNWFKANILERCRLKKRLAAGPPGTSSDLEPSECESEEEVPPEDEPAEPDVEEPPPEPEVEEPPPEPEVEEPPPEPEVEVPPAEPENLGEEDLQTQLDAMMAVLNASDEVEQLVLRNTGLTDDLLWNLVEVLKRSPSEVTLLNLNLNRIGPFGAHVLLDLIRAKPQVQGIHIFGNKLRDYGLQILVNGIVELQEQTASEAVLQDSMLLQSDQDLQYTMPLQSEQHLQQAMLPQSEQLFQSELHLQHTMPLQSEQHLQQAMALQSENPLQSEQHLQHTVPLQSEQQVNPDHLVSLSATWGSLSIFTLLELDIGGNGLASDGLRLLAAYMRHYSSLQYLGLAQTSGADLAAWKELFDSLKENSSLTHIVLDESSLGDPGVRMLADVLRVSVSLRLVDLDRNGISDVGGNDLMGALLCRTRCPLSHLSLQENDISPGLMRRIQEEVKNT
ncbi:uncharacterized protein LOC132467387 isoform X2 [Gadus macrocephalus]|uniref:uncharacterized protein LOC132467387 isoform X2 n=1 Tax=Gadus macrocephalus TaxID=80720 RepID=UPI0028CB9761|nr:uncharacterized protein LOC132467387 isoform X2 [Gadus macrocephalus]